MRFLVVDDEKIALQYMERTLRRLYPDADIFATNDYRNALALEDENFTVAFLDIEMPGMSGVKLAEELRKHNEHLNVIFVTAYDDYALDAYRLHASGYVCKPFTADDIRTEMENLRYGEGEKKLTVRCFGNFEVFNDKVPVKFERTSAKEIFAYLVHLKGSTATRDQICSVLWEDSEEVERRKGYFRSIMASLRKTLKDLDMEDVLITGNNSYAVNTEKLNCDYYRFLNGESSAQVRFRGIYMSQYSWAEEEIQPLIELSIRQ